MADEKPKTLQEQSSPTGPPVSQEVKDTAPAVAQPGEEKDNPADTKSVEAKETEAADSKKLDIWRPTSVQCNTRTYLEYLKTKFFSRLC